MRHWLGWLMPGVQVKRWLLLFSLGLMLTVAGLILAFDRRLYQLLAAALRWLIGDSVMSKLPAAVQGALLGLLGLAAMAWAVTRVVRWVTDAGPAPAGASGAGTASGNGLGRKALERRLLSRGPRIVVIGGGTGLPAALRGLKEYSANITAVVTVADDGGSSGRLRGEFQILPPGDIRNCLVALADTEGLMEQLFMHRFDQGDGLAGHSFGNLFILALTAVTGDFETALRQSSEVLAIRGQVLPATVEQVALEAELANGGVVRGESRIGDADAPIRRVRLVPEHVAPVPAVLAAIAEADLIVLGPGSLYTSVIPNLLVPGVADAIRASQALKVYVCNIMTQPGETDGYECRDHLQALMDHAGPGIVSHCLVNTAAVPADIRQRYEDMGAEPVRALPGYDSSLGVEVIGRPLLDPAHPGRHDSEQLAAALLQLLLARRGAADFGRTPWDVLLWRERLEARQRQAARANGRPAAVRTGRLRSRWGR